MEMLPSGLPEIVADEEDLARFLTSRGHFNSKVVKPSAFMPEIEDRETSVFRHGSEPRETLWAIGDEHAAQGRTIYGAGIIKARSVREIRLDVFPDEPPPRHAAIRGWPWTENDPDLRKAEHKEFAVLLASNAELFKK
jgi:hypothetical protein